MEEKEKSLKDIYETMKQNSSLEPIADLVRLVMVAKNTAKKAEEIGDKLSVFACQAEAAQNDLPPVTAWMALCDKYKIGAREFANALNEAVKVSQVGSLYENLHLYTQEIEEKTEWMMKHDETFREMFEETEEDDEFDADDE